MTDKRSAAALARYVFLIRINVSIDQLVEHHPMHTMHQCIRTVLSFFY